MGENKSFMAQRCMGKRAEERMNPDPIKHSYQEQGPWKGFPICLKYFFDLYRRLLILK